MKTITTTNQTPGTRDADEARTMTADAADQASAEWDADMAAEADLAVPVPDSMHEKRFTVPATAAVVMMYP